MSKLTICQYEAKMIIAVFFWILLYRPRRHHRRSVGERRGSGNNNAPSVAAFVSSLAQEEGWVGGV